MPASDSPAVSPPVYWDVPQAIQRRGRGLGELLAQSLSILGRGWVPLLLVSALQLAGVVIFVAFIARYGNTLAALVDWIAESRIARILGEDRAPLPTPPVDFWILLALATLLWSFVGLVTLLALLRAANEVIHGRTPSPGASLIAGFDRVPAFIGLLLLGIAALIAIVVVFVLAGVLLGPIGVLFDFVLLVAGIYLWIRLMPTIAVLAVEDQGPFKALARSWRLTRGNGLLVFGFVFVAGLLAGSAQAILSAIVDAIGPTVGQLAWATLGLIVSGLLLPWTAVTSVVLLDELRQRNDPKPEPSTS